jgi:hypothetical protein
MKLVSAILDEPLQSTLPGEPITPAASYVAVAQQVLRDSRPKDYDSHHFWYRYDDDYGDLDNGIRIQFRKFRILRATKAMVLLDVGYTPTFVLKDARKRFAYPTIELARESFEIRKRRQLQHINNARDRIAAIVAAIDAGTVYDPPNITLDWFEFKLGC